MNARHLCSAFLLLTVMIGCQRAPAPAIPEEAPVTDVSVNGAVDVPMLILTDRPVAEVFLNGKGPYRFGIETGARFLGLTPRVLAEVGLPRVGGTDEEPLVRVGELRIGEAAFKGITAVTTRFGDTKIDGIIGLNVFAEVLLTLDSRERKITIQKGTLPQVDGRDVLALKPIGSLVGVDVTIAGKPFVAAVDTRGAGWLTMMPQLASTVPFVEPLRDAGHARGSAIPVTERKTGTLAGDLRMGGYVIRSPAVLVHATPSDFPQVPILGSQLLREFTFTLDQKHGRIRFQRGDRTVTPPSGS